MSDGESRDTSSRLTGALWTIALATIGAVLWVGDGLAVPLAYAIFAACAVDPLRRRLDARVPRWLSVLVCLLVVLVVLGALATAIALCLSPVAEDWSTYERALLTLRDRVEAWAASAGVTLGGGVEELGSRVGKAAGAFLSGFGLAVGFFVLAVAEIRDCRAALHRAVRPSTAERLTKSVRNTAADVRAYLLVRTVVGLLTGALVVGTSYAVGLELPWVWGGLNFVLNYIPTLGSVVGILPPVLFGQAMGGGSDALLALVAVGGVQLVMGVVVDPLLQGRRLAISPLAVLVSVVFWGALWGMAGAFIATPMTMLIARLCEQFDRSRWVFELLIRGDPTR